MKKDTMLVMIVMSLMGAIGVIGFMVAIFKSLFLQVSSVSMVVMTFGVAGILFCILFLSKINNSTGKN